MQQQTASGRQVRAATTPPQHRQGGQRSHRRLRKPPQRRNPGTARAVLLALTALERSLRDDAGGLRAAFVLPAGAATPAWIRATADVPLTQWCLSQPWYLQYVVSRDVPGVNGADMCLPARRAASRVRSGFAAMEEFDALPYEEQSTATPPSVRRGCRFFRPWQGAGGTEGRSLRRPRCAAGTAFPPLAGGRGDGRQECAADSRAAAGEAGQALAGSYSQCASEVHDAGPRVSMRVRVCGGARHGRARAGCARGQA